MAFSVVVEWIDHQQTQFVCSDSVILIATDLFQSYACNLIVRLMTL